MFELRKKNKELKRSILVFVLIVNAVIVYTIFALMNVSIAGELPVANTTPAFAWSIIAYFIIKKQTKRSKDNILINNQNSDYKTRADYLAKQYGYLTYDFFEKEIAPKMGREINYTLPIEQRLNRMANLYGFSSFDKFEASELKRMASER